MSKTLTYSRSVKTLTAETPVTFSLKAAELPNLPVSLVAGNSASIDVRLQLTSYPSNLVKDFFILSLTPSIDGSGLVFWTGTITPVYGNGTFGKTLPIAFPHVQNLDSWQLMAGEDRVDLGDFMIETTVTGDYTLLSSDNLKIFTNAGATDTVIITLPAAVDLPMNLKPYRIRGRVSAGQILRFQTSGSDVIYQGSAIGGAGGYIESASPGAQIELLNDEAGKWVGAPLGPTNWGLA